MHYGGAFLDRKTTLLRQLREDWIPKGFSHTGTLDKLPKGIEFPVIAKPDKGVTGIGIKKCSSLDQLNAYLTAAGAMRVRIESFVDLPHRVWGDVLFPSQNQGIRNLNRRKTIPQGHR